MLRLRRAQWRDLPEVLEILTRFRAHYLDDYHDIDARFIVWILFFEESFVIEADHGLVGLVWFRDVVDDLHVTLHTLVVPQHLKSMIREGVFQSILDFGFEWLGVLKVKAEPMVNQTSAIKLLKKFGFQLTGYFANETKQNGKPTALLRLELCRSDWRQLTQKNAIINS